MKLKKTIITIVLITVGSLLVQAATDTTQTVTGLSAIRVASGLTKALYVTAPPGDTQRLFIVRQTGQIHILNLVTGKLYPDVVSQHKRENPTHDRAGTTRHGVRPGLR